MKTMIILWKKYMRKMSGEEMIGMLIQPVLWVLIFSRGMTGMMSGGMQNREYLTFLLPGIMALTALGGAIGGGFTWLGERTAGLIREYWVAPVSRAGLLLGNSAANITKVLIQTAVITGVGIIAGAALSTSVLGILGVIALTILFGLGFSSIALALASKTKNEGGYHAMMMMLNLPLLFLSNALYALDSMPGWMRVVSKINPTSYFIDGARQLMIGDAGDFPLWLCFIVVGGFGFAFLGLAVGAFKKSNR